jgi:two-component SAPR family response regulator
MKLLAVDDEKIALDHILSLLRRINPAYETVGCRSGSAAVAKMQEHMFDIVFLDINLRDIDGIELAKKLKLMHPNVNIIFTTGYGSYAGEAFELHASGYVLKPLTEEKIRKELNDLRHPVSETRGNGKLKVHTFGNFEVYDRDGIPLSFQYAKSKEMFAYLIDRCGAFCANGEIMGVLWGDEASERKRSYLKNLRTDLNLALEKAGFDNILIRRRGMIAVLPDQLDCDYYEWMKGVPSAINAYRGEYMVQYSWSEFTNSQLERMNQ